MDEELGRLDRVPVREVWPHEAHDFTRWLLDNADVLSEVLGMQLELEEAEHRVGRFALDLLGTDLLDGSTVIVENQLGQTDHAHLGQLLTYAGGTDPKTVVWCAPSFCEEHRAALDWLNERTDEQTRFFAVEVSAVRIDDSRPAPLFRLVAQPNDWSKQIRTETSATLSLSGRAGVYGQFWATILERVRAEHPGWTNRAKAGSRSYLTLPFGNSSTWYGFVFTSSGPAVELYFGGPSAEENMAGFERMRARRSELDGLFGEPLTYEELEGKKACRISFARPGGGDILDEAQHADYVDWFVASMDRLRSATQSMRGGGGTDDE